MASEFSLEQMVKQQVRTWDVLDSKVLDVMMRFPRSRFVPLQYQSVAYADFPIPLDHGQHMLTPKVVGRILQALDLQPTDSVLELGTGSGYLAVCMAALAGQVKSVDRHPGFIEQAAEIASDMGLNNLSLETRSDYQVGHDQLYDAIVLRESMRGYDPSYESLLNPGGRLYVCVGEPPVLDAMLVVRQDQEHYTRASLFEAVADAGTADNTPASFEF